MDEKTMPIRQIKTYDEFEEMYGPPTKLSAEELKEINDERDRDRATEEARALKEGMFGEGVG